MGGTNVTIASCAINNHNEGVVVGTLAAYPGGEGLGGTNKTSSGVSLLNSEVGFTRCAGSRWSGGNRSALTPSGPCFAYSLSVHSFHTRRDRVASSTTCR